jgi:glycerophosphoryl diester phosphodiesterase
VIRAAFILLFTLAGSLAMAAEKPLIIAHRGASGLAPENTLAAFRTAIEVGADGIEFDVQLTRDGQAVVVHDFRISKEWARLDGHWIDGEGPAVRDLSLAEIRRYDVGRLRPFSQYAKRYPDYRPADGARVPTLAEVLALVRDEAPAGFQMWLELKVAPADEAASSDPIATTDATLAALQEFGLVNQTVLISFHWPALYYAQRLMPGLKTGYLSAERSWLNNIRLGQPDRSPWTAPFDANDYGRSIPRTIKAAGGYAWSVYHGDLTPERLADATAQGLQVGIWTIRNRSEIPSALATGAAVITTDRPDWFR